MRSIPTAEARQGAVSPGLIVGLGFIALSFYALCYGLLGPSLSILGHTFDISLPQQGLLMTAYALGYLLAVSFGGYRSDRRGKGGAFTWGLALMGCGMLLVATSRSYARALLGTCVVGGGGGLIEMSASAMTSDALPTRRGSALNFLQVVFGLSGVSPLLLTWRLSNGGTWRSVFVGLGIGTLLLMLVSSTLRWPFPLLKNRIDPEVVALVIRRPRLWGIAGSQALYVFSEAGLASWAVTYLISARAATIAQANGAVSLFWVTMGIGRLACSALASRVRLNRLMICLSTGGTLGLIAVFAFPRCEWAWVLVGIAGLFYSGIFATNLAYAGGTYSAYSGTVFGVIMGAGAAGALVGPWLIGLIAEATTISLAFGLVAASLMGTALIYARLGPSTPDPLS